MTAPSKRAVLERLLDQGMVMVHVDSRRAGVRVPVSLRGDPQLRLNLSYRFASRDLSISDVIVRCTLSFGGQPFYCELPLEAVFAVTSHATGEAIVWPETLAAALQAPAEEPLPRPAKLEVAASAPGDARDEASGAVSSAPRRGHLRLVK